MSIKDHLNNIIQETEQYAEAKLEETSLKTVEKSIDIMTGVLSWLVIAGVALFILGSLSLVGLLVLAELTGSMISAGLIVMGIFFVIFMLLLVFNKRLLGKPIKNFLLGEYLYNYKKSSDE